MPTQPGPTREDTARQTAAAEHASAVKRAEYNLPKVIAGGAAAATTAVVGSYFGVAGTVVGAAIAAIVTSVATTTFQRGLDRTTHTVRSRVVSLRHADPGSAPTAVMPPVTGHPDDPTVAAAGQEQTRLAPPVPAQRGSRFTPRRLAVMAGVAVLAFVIGLFVVTGIEWIKGSPISGGESGTSVGRVLRPASAGDTTTTAPPTGDSTSDRSSDSRPTETRSPETSQNQAPFGGDSGSSRTSIPPTTGSAPTTSRGGDLLPDIGSGGPAANGNAGSRN